MTQAQQEQAERQIHDDYEDITAEFLVAALPLLIPIGLLSASAAVAVLAPAIAASASALGAAAVVQAVRVAMATSGEAIDERAFARFRQQIETNQRQALSDVVGEQVRQVCNTTACDTRDETTREALNKAFSPDDPAWVEHVDSTAATTGTAAAAAGTVQGAQRREQATGRPIKLVWQTRRDADVRAAHRRAQGHSFRPGERLMVGMCALRFPGDPLAKHASCVVNCRCWLSVS